MLRRDPVDWKTPDERESEMASDEDRFPHMSRLKGRVLVAKPRPPVRRDTPQQRADFERRFPNANRLK
jgi:hypothetical protein